MLNRLWQPGSEIDRHDAHREWRDIDRPMTGKGYGGGITKGNSSFTGESNGRPWLRKRLNRYGGGGTEMGRCLVNGKGKG